MAYTSDIISQGIDTQFIPDNTIGLDNVILTGPVQLPEREGISQPDEEWDASKAIASALSTSDQNAQLQSKTFDWNNADRYVQNKNYTTVGYDPFSNTKMVEGKPYDNNELRYAAMQTWGDVMSNAVGGFWGIAKNSFSEGFKGDARLFNALFGWNSDNSFKERLIGTPEELAAMDKEQKAIFNKYAIYHTPESDNTTFNKQFLGDIIQQLGFTVGTTAQFLTEAALTWGIGEAFSAATKGTRLAVGLAEQGNAATKAVSYAERMNDARRVSDISKNTSLMRDVVSGFGKWSAKQLNPLTGINDLMKISEAGASAGQKIVTTVGGAKRLFSQVNMAATEARFEAASTFGQLYGDLIAKYENEHEGQSPIGVDLEDIQAHAYGAATDNFIVNTGLLMTMNQLQFGNMFSKFGSSSKLLRGALEAGDKDAFTVAGEILGKKATKIHMSGRFGALGKFNTIRKDFGIGTALWEVAKHSGTGTAAKFEITEGLQELMQNSSNDALRTYYTNLYDGGKDIHGASLLDADYSKAFAAQMNKEGWKTFLMGAVTGLFMSPLQASVMYGVRKGYGAINEQYKGEQQAKKKELQANIDLQNSFYNNIGNALNPNIDNIKTQGQNSKNIEGALAEGNKYQFNNSKDDILTKAVAASIKTGNFDSLISTIKEYATTMSDEELKDGFPAIDNAKDIRAYVMDIAQEIEAYHTNWQNLKDEFSHLVMPELYKNDPKLYSAMLVKKRALDEAIETLATTSYKATRAILRAAEIKDTVSAYKDIGSSLFHVYDTLGSDVQLGFEIENLHKEIELYDSLGRDAAIKDEKINARKRLQHLMDYKEYSDRYNALSIATEEEYTKEGFTKEFTETKERMQKAFNDYTISYIRQNPSTPVSLDTTSLPKAFDQFIDYKDLYRDHYQYIEALNVLTQPKNFKTLFERIIDGMNYASTDLKEKADAEAADAVGEDETPEDTTIPEDVEDIPPSPLYNLPQIKADIIAHIENDTDMPQSTRDYLALPANKLLMKAITVEAKNFGTGAYSRERLEKAIDSHFKEQVIPEEKPEDTPPPIPTTDFKLKVPHTLVAIGAHREPGMDNDGAQERLTDILKNITPKQLHEDLVITATVNTDVAPDFAVQGNTSIIQKGQPLSIQISLGDTPLGYLTNNDPYIFKIDGKDVGANDITPENIGQVVDLKHLNISAQEAYNIWSNDLAISNTITKAIQAKMVQGKTVLTGTEVSDILSLDTHPFMDFVSVGDIAPLYSELDISDFSVPVANGDRRIIVVSNKLNEDGSKDMVMGLREDLEYLPAIPVKSLGMYSAAVQVGGKVKWIQLTPAQYNPIELQDNLTRIGEEAAKDEDDRDPKVITDLTHTIFTALPVYTILQNGEKVEDEDKKVKMTIGYNSTKNTFSLSINFFKDKTKKDKVLTLGAFKNIATPELLAQAITKAISKTEGLSDLVITPDMFKVQVPLTGTYDEIKASVMGMTASVQKNVVRSISITAGTPSDTTYEEIEPSVETAGETYTIRDGKVITPIEEKKVPTIAEQKAARKKAQEELNKNKPARKIDIPVEGFDEQSIENIDRFMNFVRKNLPDFISVEDMGILQQNLVDNKVTVGQFITRLGTLSPLEGSIRVYKNSPFKYHEAFHGVFRMLLSQDKINKLFDIARKEYPVTERKLQDLRELHSDYSTLDRKELEERLLEEYMADKFNAWILNKKTPTSHVIKGFFATLLDWIKSIWNKLTGQEMEGLFYDINKGRYKKAELQQNQFTAIHEGFSDPAMKVIKVGEELYTTKDGTEVYIDKYLPQSLGDQLSSTIAALYHKAVTDKAAHNKNEELNKILDIYKATYNTDLPIYQQRADAIADEGKRLAWVNKLIDLETVFSEPESRKSLMESVDLHLQIMGYKQELEDDAIDTVVQEVGDRNTDTAHKKTASLSDYGSLSKFLRGYIGSTTYNLDKDDFGNSFFLNADGTENKDMPLVATVNANKVYNGLLKTLSNSSDEQELLEKMIEYRKHSGNPETVKFINRLLGAKGVAIDEQTSLPTKNPILLQQVLKGFNQYETSYLFTLVQGNGRYKVSNANTQSAARNQFSTWHDHYTFIDKVGTSAVRDFIDTISSAGGNMQKILTQALDKKSDKISKDLKAQTGVYLHPMYIKYSILSGKDASVRTAAQQRFLELFGDGTDAITQAEITAGLLEPLKKGLNIYSVDPVTGSPDAVSFLTKIAGYNARFDEAVNTMSFTNADRETVYAHSLPNYDFVRVRELNKSEVLDELRNSPDHNSALLSDPKFLLLADRGLLSVCQIDGIRKGVEFDVDEEGRPIYDKEKVAQNFKEGGATFDQFNRREFIATLLGLYDIREQPDSRVREGKDIWYRTAHATRTIESKGNIHLVRLAVQKTVNSNGNLSKKALDTIYSWIKTESDRIQRVKKEIAGIANGTYTGDVIEGYHTSAKGKEPRGLHLFTTALMVGDLVADIENGDINEDAIKVQIEKYWKEQTVILRDIMADEGLISVEGNKVSNILAPDYLFNGFQDPAVNEKMAIGTDFMTNLTQVMLNDLINTTEINKLLMGDEAKSFVDSIDQVKRMAGANATGPSMNIAFEAPAMGIEHTLENIHHITYVSPKEKSSISGQGIDSDDGQMYMTAKGLRYSLFGFGKLTATQAALLDKIENGGVISSKEFFDAGGLKDNGAFNSLKLVYYDGSTYLKCSAVYLDKNMTALPGMEDLDNLRTTMEDFEDRNKTVVFAHPVSASKGLKRNIATSIGAIEDKHFNTLQAKYMRQQLENPSNKLVITDPTQAKQQIMAEQVDSTPVHFLGTQTTVGAVKAAYMNDVAQRTINNYQRAANSIFTLNDALIELDNSRDIGQVTPRLGEFFEHIRDTLQATGSDQQTLQFLEVRDGQPVYNLNFPSTLEKFTQIFLSYFSKGVLAEKVPGLSLALMSGALGAGRRVKQVISLDDNGQPKEWKVITTKEYLKNKALYSNAHRWSDRQNRTFTGLSKGDYYIDDLRHNVAEYDSQGHIVGRFSEYIRPAHYKEEMNGPVDSLSRGFGIRIPSDDKHSYISLRMVDTMPVQYGSVGIFPHELVEISGADFDIDKMYISIPDTYTKNGTRIAYGTADTAEGQFSEYVEYTFQNNKDLKNKVQNRLKTDADVQELLKELHRGKEQLDELLQQIIDNNRFIGDHEGNLKLFKETKKSLIAAYKESGQGIEELKDTISQIEAVFKLQAMEEAHMPSTVQEFIQAGGADILNNGVLNNRILAERLALQSNSAIAGPIADTPTSTDPLTTLADSLEQQGLIQPEANTEVNSLIGKTVAYGNNKEGERNIGAAANAVQDYSLLNQFGVRVEQDSSIILDGHDYTSFGNTREFEKVEPVVEEVLFKSGKNTGLLSHYIVDGKRMSKREFEDMLVQGAQGEFTGTRILSNLSTLLNAMTDNAKERLAARLGLNVTALGFVSNMVSLGIPLETSVLLMLQPSVKAYFKNLSALNGSLKTAEERGTSKMGLLSRMMKDMGWDPKMKADDMGYGREELVEGIQSGTPQLYPLMVLHNVNILSGTIRNITRIQKLTQGLPTTWEDVQGIDNALNDLGIENRNGVYVTKAHNVDSEDNELPIDVRDVLLYDHRIIATNIKILGQIQELSKKIFLEKTPAFKRMSDVASANMKNLKAIETADFNKNLKQDLISFLTIKAYKKWLINKGAVGTVESMDTAVIYPSQAKDRDPGFRDIHKVIADIKDKIGDNRNYMVSNFLMLASKDNMQTAEANTWAKLSDLQQDKLVSSFADLYSNAYKDSEGNDIHTHEDAIAMFNYLLVKDGGQFTKGTYIRFIPVFMFKDIMDITTKVNDLLGEDDSTIEQKDGKTKEDIEKQKKEKEERVVGLFGADYKHIMDEFVQGYGVHVGNKPFVQTIRVDNFSGGPVKLAGDTLTINLYEGVPAKKVDPDGFAEGIANNKALIEGARFTIDKEKGILFPYSIQIKGDVYTLQEGVISGAENIYMGSKATYKKAIWVGNPSTFRAQGVFGALPEYKESKVAGPKEVATDEEGNYIAEAPVQGEKLTFLQQLAQYGITLQRTSSGPVAVKDGVSYVIPAGTTANIDTIRNLVEGTIESQEGDVSSQLSSQDWKDRLTAIYGQKERTQPIREWLSDQLDFRDRAQSIGAADEDILNAIKCL